LALYFSPAGYFVKQGGIFMGKTTRERAETRELPPGITQEALQDQISYEALMLAQERIRDGTASSQIVCHFLDLSTEKSRLERAKLEAEVALKNAQAESIADSKRIIELYQDALGAFKMYATPFQDTNDEDIF
jgi:hypothetical protein